MEEDERDQRQRERGGAECDAANPLPPVNGRFNVQHELPNREDDPREVRRRGPVRQNLALNALQQQHHENRQARRKQIANTGVGLELAIPHHAPGEERHREKQQRRHCRHLVANVGDCFSGLQHEAFVHLRLRCHVAEVDPAMLPAPHDDWCEHQRANQQEEVWFLAAKPETMLRRHDKVKRQTGEEIHHRVFAQQTKAKESARQIPENATLPRDAHVCGVAARRPAEHHGGVRREDDRAERKQRNDVHRKQREERGALVAEKLRGEQHGHDAHSRAQRHRPGTHRKFRCAEKLREEADDVRNRGRLAVIAKVQPPRPIPILAFLRTERKNTPRNDRVAIRRREDQQQQRQSHPVKDNLLRFRIVTDEGEEAIDRQNEAAARHADKRTTHHIRRVVHADVHTRVGHQNRGHEAEERQPNLLPELPRQHRHGGEHVDRMVGREGIGLGRAAARWKPNVLQREVGSQTLEDDLEILSDHVRDQDAQHHQDDDILHSRLHEDQQDDPRND